jgi:hypothetical protein
VSSDAAGSDAAGSDAAGSDAARSDAARSDAARPHRPRGTRRGPARWPILLVVIGALVAAAVYQGRDHSPSPEPAVRSASALAQVAVPPSDAVSATWYCAEGTSNQDGRADETILIANVSRTDVEATITVMTGGDAAPRSRQLTVAAGDQAQVKVASIVAAADPGVVVEVVGGRAVVGHLLVHGDDIASEPCSRSAATKWYFAAGTTVKGSQHYLVLFNPFGDDAIADVTFLTDGGVQEPDDVQGLVVPRRSRVTVAVHDLVPRQAVVATEVRMRAGRVVAERDQIFDGTAPDAGPTRQGIALSLGATAEGRQWVVPAGTTEGAGTASVAVANFGAVDTEAEVSVLLPDGRTASPQSVPVPSRGVVSVDLSARVPADSAYAVVVRARNAEGATEPLVAETLAWWPPSSSSTAVASTLAPVRTARRWVVMLPDVNADALITVANVGTRPVTATLLPAGQVDRRIGPTSEPELAVGKNSADTFRVPDLRVRNGVVVITADHPVFVGLTIIGSAGVSTSAAVPDLEYGG